MNAFRDPEVRQRLGQGASSVKGQISYLARWAEYRIVEGFSEENKKLVGQTIGEIAARRGGDPFDTVLDVALADGLRTPFSGPLSGDDPATWKLRSQYWGILAPSSVARMRAPTSTQPVVLATPRISSVTPSGIASCSRWNERYS